MSAALIEAKVWHRRLRPRVHAFTYPMLQIRFALDRQESLGRPVFSLQRFNLFSFRNADHGPRDGSPLLPWIRALLHSRGLDCADGVVELQTMPRVLGYVFNPISFWFCHDREGGLRAILCEVNNTFGGHEHYLLAHEDARPIAEGDRLSADKKLHVSPFCQVRGQYSFRFLLAGERQRIRIDYDDGEGALLNTAISGRARPLSTTALLSAFLRYPWLTLAVWLRIHYQGLRLWLKGIPFYGKTPPQNRHEEV